MGKKLSSMKHGQSIFRGAQAPPKNKSAPALSHSHIRACVWPAICWRALLSTLDSGWFTLNHAQTTLLWNQALQDFCFGFWTVWQLCLWRKISVPCPILNWFCKQNGVTISLDCNVAINGNSDKTKSCLPTKRAAIIAGAHLVLKGRFNARFFCCSCVLSCLLVYQGNHPSFVY